LIPAEKDRKVTQDDGKLFASRIKAPFFETSAKAKTNVNECFSALVREVKKWKESHGGKNSKKPGTPGKPPGTCVLL
jgi:GTPase SAR1 family protein